MKTKQKETQESNGSKCEKKEFLSIEIFNHFLKSYSYIIWNGKHLLGEVKEDSIVKLLNKDQLVDFYYSGSTKFKIERWKIDNYLSENDK